MQGTGPTRTESPSATSKGLAERAMSRLANMDRTEELCLLTAAFCAFGSAVAAQMRNG